MSEAIVSLVDSKSLVALFGARDQHLRSIREALGVSISAGDGQLRVQGDEPAVAKATAVLEQLQAQLQRTGQLLADDVAQALFAVRNGNASADIAGLDVVSAGRKVRPRTPGQINYCNAIHDFDLVFCIGPAGTGKTYLAVAMAVTALKQERIRKIVLVRPAVEAGERL